MAFVTLIHQQRTYLGFEELDVLGIVGDGFICAYRGGEKNERQKN